jgi:hypothetical protein
VQTMLMERSSLWEVLCPREKAGSVQKVLQKEMR